MSAGYVVLHGGPEQVDGRHVPVPEESACLGSIIAMPSYIPDFVGDLLYRVDHEPNGFTPHAHASYIECRAFPEIAAADDASTIELNLNEYGIDGSDVIPISVSHEVAGCNWSHYQFAYRNGVYSTSVAELLAVIQKHHDETHA